MNIGFDNAGRKLEAALDTLHPERVPLVLDAIKDVIVTAGGSIAAFDKDMAVVTADVDETLKKVDGLVDKVSALATSFQELLEDYRAGVMLVPAPKTQSKETTL